MREKVLAMQTIWTEDEAAFHGRFVDFDPIMTWPKPVQKPYPPVLVGGGGHLSLRAAAEYGDGWIPTVDDMAAFEEQLAELHRLCDEAGRPHVPATACLWVFDERHLVRCAELGVDRVAAVATPDVNDMAALRNLVDDSAELGRRTGIATQ